MATPDPVWRVRTRPCPFYQRGACIFAANCNFLHTGPAGRRKDSGYDSDSSTRSLKSPEPMGHPPTPLKKPVLVVDSPRSVSTPLREPHMARLLSALSPVIGDEDDGEEEEADEPYLDSATLVEPDSAAWSAGLPTLTHGEDSAFFARVTETMAEMMEATESDDDDEDDPENTMLENHDDNDPYDFSDAFFSKSQNDSGSRSRSSSGSSHHASPSILRSRNYAPPSPSDDTLRLPANNNHIPEPTETPSIHTTHSSPEPEQILEMPAIPDNHDDLLSPVDLSHLQLHNFSGLSPDLWQSSNPFGDTNYNNNNAESSNNTTMPAFASFMPHPSPPKSPGLMMSTTSAVGILRSPFGSPLRPSLLSPRIGAFFRPSPSSSPQANVSQPVHSLEDDLDSPSQHQWNAIASPSQLPYAASESGEVEEGRGSPSPSSSSSESESDSGSESPEEEDEESISDEEHEDFVPVEDVRSRGDAAFEDDLPSSEIKAEDAVALEEDDALEYVSPREHVREADVALEEDLEPEEFYREQDVAPISDALPIQEVAPNRDVLPTREVAPTQNIPPSQDVAPTQDAPAKLDYPVSEDSELDLVGREAVGGEKDVMSTEPVAERAEATSRESPVVEDIVVAKEVESEKLNGSGMMDEIEVEEEDAGLEYVSSDDDAESEDEEEDSGSESESDVNDNDNTQEHESYGHTDIWDAERESTSVYVGGESPYQAQVEEELQRQRSQSLVEPAGDTSALSWADADGSSPNRNSASRSPSPIQRSAFPSPSPASSGLSYDASEKQRWTLDYAGGEISSPPGDTTLEAIDYHLSPTRSSSSAAPASSATPRNAPLPEHQHQDNQDLTVGSYADATVGSIEYMDVELSPVAGPSFIADVSPDEDESFESPALAYSREEEVEDSFLESPDSMGDSTAQLGYLQPEDTLNSLYNVYNDMPPSPKAAVALSDPSTTPSSLRERVFTPPPDKTPRFGRGSATHTPPPVPSSPATSFGSFSKGRVTPSDSQYAMSERSAGRQSPDASTSKRIPFGFRGSRSSSRLSLSSSSQKQRSLPQLTTTNSASVEDLNQPPSATPPPSASSAGSALRPLRLSVLLQSHSNAHAHSRSQSSTAPSTMTSFAIHDRAHSIHATSPSQSSLMIANSLSTPRSAPHHATFTGLDDESTRPPSIFTEASQLTEDLNHLANFGSPISAPISAPASTSHWPVHQYQQQQVPQHSYYQPQVPHPYHEERASSSNVPEPILEVDHEDEEDTTQQQDLRDEPIRRALAPPSPSPPPPPHSAPVVHQQERAPSTIKQSTPAAHQRAPSTVKQSTFTIEDTKPALMFAIASDDVEQVRQVLESGEADPNECVGPQAALAFALSNENLTNKLDIVKMLLAFGADPKVLQDGQPSGLAPAEGEEQAPAQNIVMDAMDPATRYYVERAKAAQTRRTSKLINRSFFRPLARVQYDLIGQDRALEELFRLLSIHSRQAIASPLVVMFSGPSGHGKSLLARKFGSLLDIPTHTVNMVTPRSQDDLWESYSVSPIEEPTNCTLAEFLVNNEGKRCVVVLDEIEKVVNEKILWSLLMPWEHGRCSLEARSRHIDVRKVIWLCTSNIGQDLIFNHWDSREFTQEVSSRQEFLELVALLRPLVSERLGASVLSRITSVLPFVPFSLEEKRAMSAEAIFQLGGEDAIGLSSDNIESLVQLALGHYIPEEGARSLHRAISNHLVDMI